VRQTGKRDRERERNLSELKIPYVSKLTKVNGESLPVVPALEARKKELKSRVVFVFLVVFFFIYEFGTKVYY